ncbi:MAG TPA: GFA family protein [Gammaproteobacteria bacterium]|nr:GFA family protein [Gammaproteobacteria bacterium]
MRYTGSCHCGQNAFEAEGELAHVIECNCSHCSMKGYLLFFVPHEQFVLKTPESGLGVYTFNKHLIKHHFCKTCGAAPFGKGIRPDGRPMVAINARCLHGVDLASVKRVPVDGRSL